MKKTNQKSLRGFFRSLVCLLCAAALVISCLAVAPEAVQAKTYNQKGYALKKYDVGSFKTVKNKNYGLKKISSFVEYAQGKTSANKMKTIKGNKKATFKTWTYLPKNYEIPGDMGNPQSVALTPDGRYAYITYPRRNHSDQGRIIRYDLKKLKELGVTNSDKLTGLYEACISYFKGRDLTDEEKAIMKCMKVGPWYKNFGHGAAFAYNPKDKHLWYCGKTGSKKTNLIRINMSTLKPDTTINFTMYGTVNFGNNLTFDKKGNLYFFSYSGGDWKNAPKGTIKIYKGDIDLKRSKPVRFNLVMQGIRYRASENIQSIGYNPKSNRLYMVSNCAIISVPVSKLGKLKKTDVHTTILSDSREFEGLAFDKSGNGYLLVNKQPELMKASSGF